jgi:hypothetical protein
MINADAISGEEPHECYSKKSFEEKNNEKQSGIDRNGSCGRIRAQLWNGKNIGVFSLR